MTQQQEEKSEVFKALYEVLANDETAPFGRIKYMGLDRGNVYEEDRRKLINEMFHAAVLGYDSGDYGGLDTVIRKWEDVMDVRNVERSIRRFNEDFKDLPPTPWAPLTKKVKEMKIALVTSGGIFKSDDKPFGYAGPHKGGGDVSHRRVPVSIAQADVRALHGAYDTKGPQEDVNCVLPVHRFAELAKEGIIGALADHALSYVGFNPELPVVEETAPAIIKELQELGAEGVVFTCAGPNSNRTGALVAREIESAGIPTVLVMTFKPYFDVVKPPRAVITHFPFDRPVGHPGNAAQQRLISLDALRFLESASAPFTCVELPYRWRREDYEALLAARA